MIVPDLLGYDGTDKPTDPAEYRWDKMLPDLIDIADHENAIKLISIGHDFGSVCVSHLYAPYAPPGRQPFDLEAFNEMTKRIYGHTLFAYWHLFTAEDGPDILKHDLNRLYDALHGQGETLKNMFCVKDALLNHLLGNGPDIPIRPYAEDPALRKAFVDRFSRDGFEGPQCWYRARRLNYQYDADKELPMDRDTVTVPTLFVGGKDDAVCRPENMNPHIEAGLLPKLQHKYMLEAAHWIPIERPKELVAYIEPWLKDNF
ncbi:epoxide hydrolase [Fusarium beomiforme]|uniref:Epoxide hydrolase n=1 Tax=Fusarium beomiforme TaxID=44412 RepID=A0A9P5AFE5_9HYPO|nr:epoxide hydrolase [Fusarium beomiforme]